MNTFDPADVMPTITAPILRPRCVCCVSWVSSSLALVLRLRQYNTSKAALLPLTSHHNLFEKPLHLKSILVMHYALDAS